MCFRKNFKPVSRTSERFWHSLVVLGGFCLVITVTRLRTLDTYHIHFPKGENAVCIVLLKPTVASCLHRVIIKMALRSGGWTLPSSRNICTSCTAMGPLTMHYSCSSYVTLKCRDYPTCGRRRAVKHCSIPPQNRGHGTGVHEEKRAKSTPTPTGGGGGSPPILFVKLVF